MPGLNVGAVEAATLRHLAVLGFAPRASGAASGAEGPEADDPHILALARASPIASNYGVDGVPGRRSAHSDPVGHTTGNLRLVHPFSPCVVALSERPVRPIGHSQRQRPRLARNTTHFDPGSSNFIPFLPERRLGRFALPELTVAASGVRDRPPPGNSWEPPSGTHAAAEETAR